MIRASSSIPFTADGWIEAIRTRKTTQSPDEAWADVLSETPDLSPDDLALAASGEALMRQPAAYQAGISVSVERRVVAIQGGWWYRGVTAVEPIGSGALVTYVVVNIAPGWTRWVAHLFQARRHRLD